MLVYYFVPFIVSNRYLLFWVSNGHNSVTGQNRTHVYMNFFDHKDLGNHLLQLCPKVVKHHAYEYIVWMCEIWVWINNCRGHTTRVFPGRSVSSSLSEIYYILRIVVKGLLQCLEMCPVAIMDVAWLLRIFLSQEPICLQRTDQWHVKH